MLQLGVRGRLFLAFLGISALTVIAAGAAVYAFMQVAKSLEVITQERVPAALAAQKLSRQAERVVAIAPAYLSVETSSEHKELSERIALEVERLVQLASEVKRSGVDSQYLAPIESSVDRLVGNLQSLGAVVEEQLEATRRKEDMLRSLSNTNVATQRLLAPGVRVMQSDTSRLRTILLSPNSTGQTQSSTVLNLARSIATLQPLQRAQFEASAIHEMLLRASVSQPTELPILRFPLERSVNSLANLIPDLDPVLQSRMSDRVAELRSFITGSNSVLHARELEHEVIEEVRQLLDGNTDLSFELTSGVDRLVEAANRQIDLANRDALSVQRWNMTALFTLVGLSLLSSVLIVWLYVGRNLIARLSSLSDSMLSIAGGDLDATIPAGSNDEIGQMAEALSVFRDTAVEVKRTNLREIREARRRLTDAIESISEGFSLYDADDRIVVWNSRYREILFAETEFNIETGMSFESIVRRAARQGLITDPEKPVESWIEERLERHRNPKGPYVYRWAGERWIRINERKTESGGTVAVYSDVTEIKRAEEALRESEERYALAMKGVNEGLWDWRPRMDEVYISARFAELAGIDEGREKITVEEWQERIHPEDIERQHKAVRAHFRGKAPFYEAEYRVRGASGEYRWVRDRGLGLRDESGQVYRVAGSMEDMSELKEREEELRTAKEKAERALEDLKLVQRSLIQSEKMASLGQLTAGIAHEIKNPLNFINNFAKTSTELIGELVDLIEPAARSLPEGIRVEVEELLDSLTDDLGTIRKQGERADSIVQGMLLHSRRDTGEARLTDINELLAESLNLAYHGQRASTPGFNVELQQDLDPAVGQFELVSQEITRVFVNLLSNAFYAVRKREGLANEDYTPTVSVSSHMIDNEHVEIRVRDNGIGIPAVMLDELFNPFFTTKPPGEGTGLGLSISRDIVVDQHGGDLRVDSEEGVFTEFVMTLPRHVPKTKNRVRSSTSKRR